MTDAEHLKRWFGPPGGLSDATVDLREGGVFVYGIVVPGAADLRAKRTFSQRQLFVRPGDNYSCSRGWWYCPAFLSLKA
jgi:hypothetical protein